MPRKLDQRIGSLHQKKVNLERKIAELSRELDARCKNLVGNVAITHAKIDRNYAKELLALLEQHISPKDQGILEGLREKFGCPSARA